MRKATFFATAAILSPSLTINEYWIGIPGAGLVQKAFLLITALGLIFIFGAKKTGLTPLISFSLISVFSFAASALSGSEPNLSLFATSFAGMSIGLFIYAAKIPIRYAIDIYRSITLLPYTALIIATLLYPVTSKSIWANEYTGAIRLAGLLPPAHLAMLCVASLMIQSIAISYGRLNKPLLATTFLILLGTGTRGAFIAGAICMLPHIKLPKSRGALIASAALISGSIPFIYAGLSNLANRSITSSSTEELNMSGRSAAWTFFLEKVEINPFFGQGLGAVTNLTKDETYSNLSFFVVPHNEYIRFLVDFGIVGTAAVIIGLILWFFRINSKLQPNQKKTLRAIFFSLAIYSFIDNTFSTPQFTVLFLLILKYLNLIRPEGVFSNGKQKEIRLQEPKVPTNAAISHLHMSKL